MNHSSSMYDIASAVDAGGAASTWASSLSSALKTIVDVSDVYGSAPAAW